MDLEEVNTTKLHLIHLTTTDDDETLRLLDFGLYPQPYNSLIYSDSKTSTVHIILWRNKP